MRTLTKEQKPNWPSYLPSLVFAYNATPHTSTGIQPYKLMFGRKAPMPCDNWLGLENYQPDSFKSKTVWLNQQLNAMLYTNKKALKLIQQSTRHVIRTRLVVNLYTYQLGIMCYCVITQKATIKFRTNINRMCMLLLVTIQSPMSIIFSF